MPQAPTESWELSLDQPGSAEERTVRRVAIFVVGVVALAALVVAFGDIQLPAFPPFSIFHAGFVFLVDAITAFLLFGQFASRRLPSYAILGCAYLFNALVAVPFLLAFPGALKAAGGMIGGSQSAIWAWHFWHILFPAIAVIALASQLQQRDLPVAKEQVGRTIALAMLAAAALAALVAVAITQFHDSLPVLIGEARRPLTSAFYVAGGTAAAVTGVAMLLAWHLGWHRRSVLHLWLGAVLTMFLADVAASLAAPARYTVAWYFGRVESMIGAGSLLMVYLSEIAHLYRRLTGAMRNVSAANDRLAVLVAEKDQLVANLKRSEEQIRQLAYYDILTELPNRRLLLDRLHQALSQAKRHHQAMAIMFLDLDRFKQINDTLGHEAGDELLQQVAKRLAGCVREEDTVSRSGGDEFIVVLPEVRQPRDAALVAEKVIKAINEPVAIGEHLVQVGTSVGIAVYPIDGPDDVQDLMRKADTAMYAAKDAGRNVYRFYGDVAQVSVGAGA